MTPTRRRMLAAPFALAIAGPALGAPMRPPEALPDDMTLGNPKARITVVEYASASCPHCAHFSNDVFPAFRAKYIDTGKIHFVFREFLTAPPEVAAASFLLARCAGKDKYFSVLDAIFRGQQAMYQSGDVQGALVKAAKDAGLNAQQFNACMTDQAAADALNARVQRYAKEDGIKVTPTFDIKGAKSDKRIEGAPTLAELDSAIAAAH